MRRLLPAVFVVLAACGGKIVTPPPDVVVPPMVVVSGAPDEATRPDRRTEGSFTAPSALFLEGGALAVVDGENVSLRSGANQFTALPVGTSDEPATLGTLRAVTPRGAGVFLAASGGFFHDANGRLLRSPLSTNFAMETVRFVDALGAGADETLFITTTSAAVRVSAGRRELVEVADEKEPGALQAIVGQAANAALLIKGASLYRVDLAADSVTVLARGVATVTGFARRADGVVLLATSEGLLEVAADGTVTKRTLAAEGAAAVAVKGLALAGDVALLATATQVLQAQGSTTVVLGDVAAPRPNALARDASGDTWFLDGAALVRLTTRVDPMAVSFERDVKPFMTAHCRSCHATGANYAPVIDLEKYGVAKAYAARTVARLKSADSPMPPATTEVLTPAQYDVVVRWVNGGMLP